MYYSNSNFDNLFDKVIDFDFTTNETDPKILTKKEVGDVVTVVDYSAMSDEAGNIIEDKLINLDDEFIVIEINLNHKFNSLVNYTQDLLLINRRTQIKYRNPSYFTRVVHEV